MEMALNYSAANFWWQMLTTLVVVIHFLYQWVTSKDRVTKQAVDATNQRLDEFGYRVTIVEQKLLAVPDDEAIARLHSRLDVTNREMGELMGKLSETKHLLNVLHDHTLNKSR
jgi:hypothetical protein